MLPQNFFRRCYELGWKVLDTNLVSLNELCVQNSFILGRKAMSLDEYRRFEGRELLYL